MTQQSPGPGPDPDIRLVVVFRTSDVGLCALAKSVLESEGIEYAVRGEGLRDMFGWNAPGSLSNRGPRGWRGKEHQLDWPVHKTLQTITHSVAHSNLLFGGDSTIEHIYLGSRSENDPETTKYRVIRCTVDGMDLKLAESSGEPI